MTNQKCQECSAGKLAQMIARGESQLLKEVVAIPGLPPDAANMLTDKVAGNAEEIISAKDLAKIFLQNCPACATLEIALL